MTVPGKGREAKLLILDTIDQFVNKETSHSSSYLVIFLIGRRFAISSPPFFSLSSTLDVFTHRMRFYLAGNKAAKQRSV